MIGEFLARAKRGESVYIDEVAAAFQNEACKITCTVALALSGEKRFEILVPRILSSDAEAFLFLKEYVYAWIYNYISVLGGQKVTLNYGIGDDLAREILESINEDFGVGEPKAHRKGYGKSLNVAERVNEALGNPPFCFEIAEQDAAPLLEQRSQTGNAVSKFRSTVESSCTGKLCGMDVGGTDIKVVGAKNGVIRAVKEFDWNPASFSGVEQLILPMIQMVRAIQVALTVPPDSAEEDAQMVRTMLSKDIPLSDMSRIATVLEKRYPPAPLDGIGISFPDVVIDDMIVGGETLKTKGIREHSPDYETEFPALRQLKQRLRDYCTESAPIHLANDGSLAAYTAAVEWAWEESTCQRVPDGVFAHTLGTELGSGWIDERGEIPPIPLEIYNCILDLGSYPARDFALTDVRSVRNFNTGLAGTLQKYTSQYGAYRMALRNLENEAQNEWEKLFAKGFLQQSEQGVFVVTEPKDMRKELLEYLMNLAVAGQPQIEQVFREIGCCLAVTWWITEEILEPKTKSRVLFGRFVKKDRCFQLMQEGAQERRPIEFWAANSSLAFTKLMQDLERDKEHTVAQFGQAVGAAYFAQSAQA